jgi:N4-(beta-N-acetylglucosaminyl)-L-asparaginase
MSATRRSFLKTTTLGIAGLGLVKYTSAGLLSWQNNIPVIISTWRHGLPANEAAWEILSKGGYALDALEAGVRVSEADPDVMSVGFGGIPDARGKVTLDACIMDENGNAGSVAYLQCIKHPVSVARLVMEKTPHVMLTGKGAQKFALENGFKKEKLTDQRDEQISWKQVEKEKREFSTKINIENHY